MSAPENKLLDDTARKAAAKKLPNWTLGDTLARSFKFDDFPSAFAFMTRVAFDAERLQHHPNWSNVYNTVEVEISSHDLGGVSQLCVELAAAMDAAAG